MTVPFEVPHELGRVVEDPLHSDLGGLMGPDVLQVRAEVTGVLVDGAGGRDHDGGDEGDQEDCHPYS